MAFSARNTWLVGLGWAGGLVAAALCGGSCVIDDPDHCRHNDGDAACSGSTPYCNQCLSSDQNKGCVDEPPEASCYFAGGEPFGADSTTGTGTGMGSGDTGTDDVADGSSTGVTPPDCSNEGAVDTECPDDRPFCVGGTCAGCTDAGGSDACATADAALPVCNPQGQCVECSDVELSACGGQTPFCGPEGTCSGCFEHSQCAPAGCNLFSAECLPLTAVYYVAPPFCETEPGGNFGTENDPWCSGASAQSTIDDLPLGSRRATVRIQGPGVLSQSFLASGMDTVVVVIAENGVPEIGNNDALQAVNNGRIYAQNVRLEGDADTTVRCNTGGKVWVRDTDITGAPNGLGIKSQSGCEVTLERTIVALNDGGGIEADDTDLRMLSSAVMSNGEDDMPTYGIHLTDSNLTASHVTLLQGKGNTGGRNLECEGNATMAIRNSIVMREDGDSISVGCVGDLELVNSVVDDSGVADMFDTVEFQAYQPSYFVSPSLANPHLQPGTPFNDVAVWQSGDPQLDLDGEPFDAVPGGENFAGCDER